MNRRFIVGALGGIVAGSVVLSGCSGSSGKSSPTSAAESTPNQTSSGSSSPATQSASAPSTAAVTSTPATASPASTASSAPAGSKAALAKIVLRPSDLPASWQATPVPNSPGNARIGAQLAKCAGGKDNTADEQTKVNSDRFSVQNLTVSSSASRYKSKADIDADVALLKRPKSASCFKALTVQQIRASLPAGTKLGAVSVAIHPGPTGGAANVAGTLHAKVSVTVQAKTVTVYLDSAFITAAPFVEAEVDYQGVGSPVPATLQTNLTRTVAQRARQH